MLGADTKKIRTADSINLIEYAYENYKYLNIEDIVNEKFGNWKEINKKRIQVEKGKNKTVVLKLRKIKNKVIPVKKSDIDNINIEINCLYYLKAPIEKGDVIGNLKITLNGEVVEVVDIVNNEEIKKKDRKDYFLEFLKSTY